MSDELQGEIDGVLAMMTEYLAGDFQAKPGPPPKFEERFAEDQKKLKELKKHKHKKVKMLISKVGEIAKLKEKSLASVRESHPEGSCFQRNLAQVRASFELDEHTTKRTLSQIVDNLTAAKQSPN